MKNNKRMFSLLLALVLCLGLAPYYLPSAEAAGVYIVKAIFPDDGFRSYVSDMFDTNGDEYLSDAEIAAVKEIDVTKSDIRDLRGVEYFTALQKLYCSRNNLTSLDVSENTSLQILDCSNNSLESLNVSKNTALQTLGCDGNFLTSLDVSKNTALRYLNCSINRLISLDVSNNTMLNVLACYSDRLTSLNVSKNTALLNLLCDGNFLTSLDISKNTALRYLYCYDNDIDTLNIGNCPKLTQAYTGKKMEKTDSVSGTKYWLYTNFDYCLAMDKNTRIIPKNPFADVAEGKYYYLPVLWAYYHDPRITSGVTATSFGVGKECTRAQIVTFLWKAAGAPEPKSTQCDFTDVKPGKYYYKAVLWAVENKITSGVGGGKFGVGKPCTREQAMTFLWKAMGSPEPKSSNNPFSDVPENKYYYRPVLWAVENKITGGVGGGKFGVGRTCTRAQIVTFLYKAYNQ